MRLDVKGKRDVQRAGRADTNNSDSGSYFASSRALRSGGRLGLRLPRPDAPGDESIGHIRCVWVGGSSPLPPTITRSGLEDRCLLISVVKRHRPSSAPRGRWACASFATSTTASSEPRSSTVAVTFPWCSRRARRSTSHPSGQRARRWPRACAAHGYPASRYVETGTNAGVTWSLQEVLLGTVPQLMTEPYARRADRARACPRH